MLQEHGTDKEPRLNLLHSFKNSLKTSAAVRYNVLPLHMNLLLAASSTHLETKHLIGCTGNLLL
jgi:hypothetical protein